MVMKPIFIVFILAFLSLNVSALDYSSHINTTCNTKQTVSVHSCDMDGDGDTDIIKTNNNSILWVETLDNGTEETHKVGTAKNPTCVFSSDIDGDGDTDILCAISARELGWYENDGDSSPTFSYHTIDSSAHQLSYLRSNDMDKDGDQDVVTCQSSGRKIIWYEQTGQNRFTAHTLLSKISTDKNFIASDIDQDGNLDFVTLGHNPVTDLNEITWYRNNGQNSPNLRPDTIIKETSQINSFYCADLDQDDDMDILAALSTNEIIWYKNSENGFTRNFITTLSEPLVNFYPEDVNHDGALDLVCKFRKGHLILLDTSHSSIPHFVRKDISSESQLSDTTI